MQGICKFGFYEVFKILYSNILGEENTYLYRTSLYLAASASAEFFADIALSPMEAVKVMEDFSILNFVKIILQLMQLMAVKPALIFSTSEA